MISVLTKKNLSNNFKRLNVYWRRDRDSNPGDPCGPNGFQDRRDRPLCHPSVAKSMSFFEKIPVSFFFLTIFFMRRHFMKPHHVSLGVFKTSNPTHSWGDFGFGMQIVPPRFEFLPVLYRESRQQYN